MPIRKKIITLPRGNVEKLAKAHNVAVSSVYNALNYSSNSEVAQLIRKEAIELYEGVTGTKVVF